MATYSWYTVIIMLQINTVNTMRLRLFFPNDQSATSCLSITILFQRIKVYSFLKVVMVNFKYLFTIAASVVSFQGDSPLHYAALNENFDIVKILVSLGADVSVPDIEVYKPSLSICRLLCYKIKMHTNSYIILKYFLCLQFMKNMLVLIIYLICFIQISVCFEELID